MAKATFLGCPKHHSIEIEPEPAPISHNTSLPKDFNSERVRALISFLVIFPSVLKASSSCP